MKKELLVTLLEKQRKDVPITKKLRYNDMKRLCKYIDSNIFDENICTLWNGYITNVENVNKGVYINFYFKGKKIALHRLLYINFIGDLANDEYLKYSCENKGKCCNVTHLQKFKYTKTKELNETKETITTQQTKQTKQTKQTQQTKQTKQTKQISLTLDFEN